MTSLMGSHYKVLIPWQSGDVILSKRLIYLALKFRCKPREFNMASYSIEILPSIGSKTEGGSSSVLFKSCLVLLSKKA